MLTHDMKLLITAVILWLIACIFHSADQGRKGDCLAIAGLFVLASLGFGVYAVMHMVWS